MAETAVSTVEVELAGIWDDLIRRAGPQAAQLEADILKALRVTDDAPDEVVAASVRLVLERYFSDGLDDMLASSPLLREASSDSPISSRGRWSDTMQGFDVESLRYIELEGDRGSAPSSGGSSFGDSDDATDDIGEGGPAGGSPTFDRAQITAGIGPSGTFRPDALRRVVLPVWYATNRRRKATSGGELGDKPYARAEEPPSAADPHPIHYGVAEVSVPDDRAIGTLHTKPLWHLWFAANPEKHFLVASTAEATGADAWLADLRSHFPAAPAGDGDEATTEDELLVYIHGYNTTWEADVERAAQMGIDLGFRGPVVSFSWPSLARPLDYSQDVRLVEASLDRFAQLLQRLARESGARKIHVVAHSLGNRIALRALTDATRDLDAPEARLGHVIFAAPDVDRDLFSEQMEVFARQTQTWPAEDIPQLTVYACRADIALEFSHWLNGGRRAGDARRRIAMVFAPSDYIDASALVISSARDDGWGHSYFCSNSAVISDIVRALSGEPAQRRWGLRRRTISAGTYYAMIDQN